MLASSTCLNTSAYGAGAQITIKDDLAYAETDLAVTSVLGTEVTKDRKDYGRPDGS